MIRFPYAINMQSTRTTEEIKFRNIENPAVNINKFNRDNPKLA